MYLISSNPFPDHSNHQDVRFLAILNEPHILMYNSLSCETLTFEMLYAPYAYSFKQDLPSSYSTTLQSSSVVTEFLVPQHEAGKVEVSATSSDNNKCNAVSAFFVQSYGRWNLVLHINQ